MSTEDDQSKRRKRLLDAVQARSDAARELRHVTLRRVGRFGSRKVKKARAEFDAACDEVAEAFAAWREGIKDLSSEDKSDEGES